jgi:signal transduction histidine kinase
MGDRGRWSLLLGSMRVRIVAAMVLLLAGSAIVSIAVNRVALRDRLDEEIQRSMRREVEEFALLEHGLNPRTGEPFGDDLAAIFDVYFQREVPDEGETLFAFLDGQLYRSEQDVDAQGLEALGDEVGRWLTLEEQEEGRLETAAGEVRYVAVPSGVAANGLFVVAHFPASEWDEIDRGVVTQVVIQFATIVFASMAGLLLAGRVLRPLRRLADTAEHISETDLTRRIPVHGRDEASRIASTFNEMLARLDAAFATQRQFLDDVGHELRVPLTVIRGHVELLDLETDPEERAQSTALVVDEIERMTRLVEDLATLAKADRPDFLTIEQVDVGDLTTDVYRKATVLCDREWVLEETATIVVMADSQRLTQALVQLAQNACQHTPPGIEVRVGSAVRDDSVTFWVHDLGPGIPPEDAERVFERFVKGPGRPENSGLGLSIVAAIAEAHGGLARLVPSDAGARFEITIPIVGAPADQRPVVELTPIRVGEPRRGPR